mgnify:CR=1 FL=1
MSKLLVVDDEERIRSMIRKYGEFEGHELRKQWMEWMPSKSVSRRNMI